MELLPMELLPMELLPIFKHTLTISFFVFAMMLLVDFIDTATNKRMSEMIKGGMWRQYTLSSFLGVVPGCLGAFMNVSLYVRGIISFGAVTGGMIATSGDEAFVMLSQFPKTALMLFLLLFICGVVFAKITDMIVERLGIVSSKTCIEASCATCETDTKDAPEVSDVFNLKNLLQNFKAISFTRSLLLLFIFSFSLLLLNGKLGPESWDWERVTFLCLSVSTLCITAVVTEHYLHSHIWEHLLKKHIKQVFLWSFAALFFVHWGLTVWDLGLIVKQHMWTVLISGALISIIPQSGPHLLFVMMFAEGVIPFSVLFTTSFVQDGHGMLPMLSYSIKDTLLIKMFNLIFGLTIGVLLYMSGF